MKDERLWFNRNHAEEQGVKGVKFQEGCPLFTMDKLEAEAPSMINYRALGPDSIASGKWQATCCEHRGIIWEIVPRFMNCWRIKGIWRSRRGYHRDPSENCMCLKLATQKMLRCLLPETLLNRGKAWKGGGSGIGSCRYQENRRALNANCKINLKHCQGAQDRLSLTIHDNDINLLLDISDVIRY